MMIHDRQVYFDVSSRVADLLIDLRSECAQRAKCHIGHNYIHSNGHTDKRKGRLSLRGLFLPLKKPRKKPFAWNKRKFIGVRGVRLHPAVPGQHCQLPPHEGVPYSLLPQHQVSIIHLCVKATAIYTSSETLHVLQGYIFWPARKILPTSPPPPHL